MNDITLAATGDYLATRRIPEGDPHFREIQSVVRSADSAITNLEITVLDEDEGTPGALSGGHHLRTTPDRLDDLKAYGFSLVGMANNHALDYSVDGLLASRRHVRAAGLIACGTGSHQAQAGQAVFHDSPRGRVALISVTSSAHRTWHAGRQRPDINGRPGLNGLRHVKAMTVTPEHFAALREVAAVTDTNNLIDMQIREGFVPSLPEGSVPFGFDLYGYPQIYRAARPGESLGLTTRPHPDDLTRVTSVIRDAALQADCVVVNLHAHEMKGDDKAEPADFVHDAARAFIDAGAHAVIGHGPHIVRGIEIYRNRLICYSTGNFVFQHDTVGALPQEWYDEHSYTDQETGERVRFGRSAPAHTDHVTVQEGLRTVADAAGEHALSRSWDSMHGILPVWRVNADGDVTEVTIHPLDLGRNRPLAQRGLPALARGEEAKELLDQLATRSARYGTELRLAPDGTSATVALAVRAPEKSTA